MSGSVRFADIAPQALSLDLQAYEVVVDSYTRVAGMTVIIHCKRLIFRNGGHIDVTGSGTSASYPEGTPAVGPQHAGAHGADGAPGGGGLPGGNVILRVGEIVGDMLISANGGDGGRGQDGGVGIKGSTGPEGRTAHEDNDRRGGPGNPGGDAGLPGAGGDGGPGGRVELITLVPRVISAQDVIRVEGGKPGSAGMPGRPGEGGDGGIGGEHRYPHVDDDCGLGKRCPTVLTPMGASDELGIPRFPVFAAALVAQNRSMNLEDLFPDDEEGQLSILSVDRNYQTYGRWIPPREMLRGSPGQPGSPRTAETEARRTHAKNGNPGSFSNKRVSAKEFFPEGGIVFYELLMSRIEFDHIKLDFGDESEFVSKINFVQEAGSNLAENSRVKDSALSIYVKASAAMEKVARGLDFFGSTAQRAPLPSYTYYQDRYLKMYPVFKEIEDAFDSAWAVNRSTAERLQEIRSMFDKQQSLKLLAEESHYYLTREIKGALVNIADLNEKVRSAQLQLERADDNFKDAVRSRTKGGCEIGELIKTAIIIAVAVQTGGAALAAAQGAAGTIFTIAGASKTLGDLWDSRQQIQAALVEIKTAGESVQDAISKVGQAVGNVSNRTHESAPEYAMERAEFDRIAAEFVDIPEAGDLRQAGYDFLASVEARNQALINYNALIVQILETQARAEAIQQGIRVLSDQLTGAVNPDDGWLFATINRIYMDTLVFAARLAHGQAMAINFKLGEVELPRINSFSLATIGAQITRNETRIENAVSRAKWRRDLVPGSLSISLRNCFSPDAWANLLENGNASFALAFDGDQGLPDEIRVMLGLRVTGISLKYVGLKPEDGSTAVPWHLIHSGLSTLHGRRGFRIAFSHHPASISGDSDLRAEDGRGVVKPDFSMDGVVEGVSPFTTWTLIIEPKAFRKVKARIGALEDVVMYVNGHYYDSFGSDS